MKKIVALLKSSMLRWWLMIAAVFTIFPTCPCCGRQGCPGGLAAGAILGGILIAMRTAFLYIRGRLSAMIFRVEPAKKP
ncbi:MAG: hypothetical protein WBE75_04690 [Candidatus Omnitrophota bacterium]